jgi:phospholipid/cholesterol/gamma-HCH transport system ATP-binding protein
MYRCAGISLLSRKIAVHFRNLTKRISGPVLLRINDLAVFERETIGFYGLPREQVEIILNHLTGVYDPDEGTLDLFGANSRQMDERNWFRYIEGVGIYSGELPFRENASVGENLTQVIRKQDEEMDDSVLSASVLRLADLVQLNITDLSRTTSEASSVVRMKVQLARALVFRPRILVLCDPTEETTTQARRHFVELVRRARRKLRFTVVLFSSDVRILEQLADRVVFLNPYDGIFVETQLRRWYHRLLPFLEPAPAQILQLSLNALHHGRIIRESEIRIARRS